MRDLAGNVSNIAFISGMIASVPGIAALMSAPVWANWGSYRTGKILIVALIISVLLLIPMAFVQTRCS